ncbi:MAG: hypothetical protein HC840_19190 [Leptolyngbyaceae cyanobacterium RM2_2_4]|nr:hypothetical protein [Leptolyngbyaceae cyanobacterium RM2_2_4]
MLRRHLNNLLDRLRGKVDSTTLDVSAVEVQDLLPGQLKLTGEVVTETLESITRSLTGVNRLLLSAGRDAVASVAKATEKVKGRKKQLAELFEIPADAAPKQFTQVSKLDELESLKRYRSLRDADTLTDAQTKELTDLYNKLYAFASQSGSRSMSASKGSLTKDLPKILAKAPDFVPYKDLGELDKSAITLDVLERGLPTFGDREEMEPLPDLNAPRKELPFFKKYQQLTRALQKALATGSPIPEADLDALEQLVNDFSAIAFLQKKRISNPVADTIRQVRPEFRSFDQFDDPEKVAYASRFAVPRAIQVSAVTPKGEQGNIEELRRQKRDIELGFKEGLVNLSTALPEPNADRIAKEIALRLQAAELLKGLAESATEDDEARLRIQERILELQKQAADLRASFISKSQAETDADRKARVEEIFRAGRAEAKPLEPLQTDTPTQKLSKLNQQLEIAKRTAKELKDFDKNAQLNPDGKAIFERRLADIEQTAAVIESRITSITERQKEFQRLSDVDAVKAQQRQQVNASNEAALINRTGSKETDLNAQIEATKRNADITEAAAQRLEQLGADNSQMRAKALSFQKQELDLAKQLEQVRVESAIKSIETARKRLELQLKKRVAEAVGSDSAALYSRMQASMEVAAALNELAADATDVSESLALKLQARASDLTKQSNSIASEIQRLESQASAAKDEIAERKANIRDIDSDAKLRAASATPSEAIAILSDAKGKVESELNDLLVLQRALNDEERKQVEIVSAIASAKQKVAEIQGQINSANRLQSRQSKADLLEQAAQLKMLADAQKPVVSGTSTQKLAAVTESITNRQQLKSELEALSAKFGGVAVPGLASVSEEIKRLESQASNLKIKIAAEVDMGDIDSVLSRLKAAMAEISPDADALEKSRLKLKAIEQAIQEIESLNASSASTATVATRIEREKLNLLISQRDTISSINRLEQKEQIDAANRQFRELRNRRTEKLKEEESRLAEEIDAIGKEQAINSPEKISEAIGKSLQERINILEAINAELRKINAPDSALESRIAAEVQTNRASQGRLKLQAAAQDNEFLATTLSSLGQILPIGGEAASNFAQALGQINEIFPNLGRGAIVAAGGVLGLSVAFGQLRDAIKVATEFERLESVIENVSGSSRAFEKTCSP